MSRRADIDTAKGLGMWLVVAGHTQPPELMQTAIYGMHMPLFFFISGLLWKGEVRLAHSVRALWRPFVVASLLSWLLWLIKRRIHDPGYTPWWGPLLATIWGGDLNGWFVHNTPLWFLTAMLTMLATLWLVCHTLNSKLGPTVLAVMGCITLWISTMLDLAHGPMSIAQGLVGGIFFSMGHWSENLIPPQNPIIGIFALLLSTIISIINGRVDLFSMQFQDPILYLFSGSLGAWGLLAVCKSPTGQLQSAQKLGRHSLLALAIHMPLLWMLRWITRAAGINDYWWLLSVVCIFILQKVVYIKENIR